MMTQVEYCFVSFKILGARRKHGDKEYLILFKNTTPRIGCGIQSAMVYKYRLIFNTRILWNVIISCYIISNINGC